LEHVSVSILGAILFAIGLTTSFAAIRRVPLLRVGGDPASDILVVIPARNEAAVIGGLIDDLARQSTRPSRVVIVDDASDDGTGDVAREHARRCPSLRVDVVTAGDPPPSWNPKSWALQRGATGDESTLVFVDADVRLDPRALDALATAHRRAGGLVSVAPLHEIETARESFSLPFNVAAIIGASRWYTRRAGAAIAAFGPCIMVERAAYQRLGGHRAVHRELVDDLAIARLFREHGEPLTLLRGGSLVRYRMYPDGFAQLTEGWTKNIAAGAARTSLLSFAVVFCWITAMLMPFVWLLSSRSPASVAVAVGGWALAGVQATVLSRQIGRFGLAGLGAPLLALAFVMISVRSAVSTVARRPVRWKGRRLAHTKSASHG
jgi:hypothetical protein